MMTGRIDRVGSSHDRERLFHIGHDESRHTIIVFGSVIEQFLNVMRAISLSCQKRRRLPATPAFPS